MFKFLFKKEYLVESLIYKYLDTFKLIQENFLKAINTCLTSPNDEDFDFLVKETHKFEAIADDIREDINTLMYGKALIPDSRSDIMGLLEAIDMIPHLFERVLYMFQIQKLSIPEFIVLDIEELVRISLECCNLMLREVVALFKKTEGIRALVTTIDTNESHCDHIERRIIFKIFDANIDPFLKLQLKEFIVQIGEISDQADRISKRINIISMKRRV